MTQNDKIIEDFLSGVIDYSKAWELILKLPKAWHRPEWEIERNKLIKNICEQCNSDSGPFILQHLFQPVKSSIIREKVIDKVLNNCLKNGIDLDNLVFEVSNEEISEFIANNSEKRKGCPECQRLSFTTRKTILPKYKCHYCNYCFDYPIEIDYCTLPKFKTSVNKIDFRSYLIEKKKIDARNFIKSKYKNEIENEVLLISMKQYKRYNSLIDTKTFCSSCAYKMDEYEKLLCYNCKKNDFNYYYYTCCKSCSSSESQITNPIRNLIIEIQDEFFSLSSNEISKLI